MPKYKIVYKSITVPANKYCWNGDSICGYFDNEGGHNSCDEGFYYQKNCRKTGYVLKPDKCLGLKGVNH